jgi:hypothetical protein
MVGLVVNLKTCEGAGGDHSNDLLDRATRVIEWRRPFPLLAMTVRIPL